MAICCLNTKFRDFFSFFCPMKVKIIFNDRNRAKKILKTRSPEKNRRVDGGGEMTIPSLECESLILAEIVGFFFFKGKLVKTI